MGGFTKKKIEYIRGKRDGLQQGFIRGKRDGLEEGLQRGLAENNRLKLELKRLYDEKVENISSNDGKKGGPKAGGAKRKLDGEEELNAKFKKQDAEEK